MKHSIRSFALLLTHLSAVSVFAFTPSPPIPPKNEVRAVWITTASGLDWPRVTGKTNQQESLRRLVHDLHDAHFNTLFFQVRPRGDAYYRSRYEPWAEALTGTLGKNPEWDPLLCLISEAHALGMEVHGWFNVFKVRGPNPVGQSTPQHISRAHPEWSAEYDGELWLNPGIPDVRKYLVSVAIDLVSEYDLDGINFDFIRYPGQRFPDDAEYDRYSNGSRRDDWRRSNITAFIAAFADEAHKLKPFLKIGSSPLGVYRDESNNDRRGSYYWVYQDSYTWLQRGWNDYLCPQAYWLIGHDDNGNPDFMRVAQRWSELTAGKHIYIGIGAYRADINARLGDYVDSARVAGAAGQAFFRWSDIVNSSALDGKYRTWALIPPMRWKDPVPPLPPRTITVSLGEGGTRTVEWQAPLPAADGDTANTYVIYRWGSRFIPFSDARAIAAILPAAQTVFVDSTEGGAPGGFYYSVTARDRMGNESAPTMITQAGGMQ